MDMAKSVATYMHMFMSMFMYIHRDVKLAGRDKNVEWNSIAEFFFRGRDDSYTIFYDKKALTAGDGYKLPDDAQYAEVKCGRSYSHLLYRLAGLLKQCTYFYFARPVKFIEKQC